MSKEAAETQIQENEQVGKDAATDPTDDRDLFAEQGIEPPTEQEKQELFQIAAIEGRHVTVQDLANIREAKAKKEPEYVEDIFTCKQLIMESVPYIQKTKQSSQLPYAFVSERDFILRVRPAMLANNVTVSPYKTELLDSRTVVTKNGKNLILRAIKTTYRFTHTPTRTYEDVDVFGEGSDTLDKSLPKAQTQALKYAIRQWLMIETGDDPDRIPSMDDENIILSDSAEKARGAIMDCEEIEPLDVIDRRIAGSHSIPTNEKVYLSELMREKRNDLMNRNMEIRLSQLEAEEDDDQGSEEDD